MRAPTLSAFLTTSAALAFSPEMSQFPTMLDEVLESRASMLLRMRLQCRVVRTDDGEAVHSIENESDSKRLRGLTRTSCKQRC